MARTRRRQYAGLLLAGACLTILDAGCQDGTPTVSSSHEEATVRGTVKIKGKLARKGKVIFDPSNVRRKMAAPVTSDIGRDGTYLVKTLVGGNTISVATPETIRERALRYTTIQYDVPSGDNTKDIEIPPPR